jgi:RimJ/RimL family protein N-acetyltransferase
MTRQPRLNELGQPIGDALPEWRARPRPPRTEMVGRYCRLVPFDVAAHTPKLFAAFGEEKSGKFWTYLPAGPFPSLGEYRAWTEKTCLGEDPLFFTILDAATAEPLGVASFLRIDPANGVIEVGHINYSPRLQRRPAASEAMFLMMQRVFDELGYRRYEWKCDALNAPSRAAALRLGFTYEGLFRQAVLYKARNRDTAWYSMLDREWPALKRAYERWLDPGNFDGKGNQKQRLSDLTRAALAVPEAT